MIKEREGLRLKNIENKLAVYKKMKKVYVGMSGDLIHPGHLNIIDHAKQYGEVIIGLVTDKGVATFKRLPAMPFEQRKIVLEHIKGVKEVVPQETPDYVANLKKYRPDFLVHGDDWKITQPVIRQRCVDVLKEWGGKVIDVPYTKGISSTNFHHYLRKVGTTSEIRIERLRRLLEAKDIVRFLEAHNGLSALIVENTHVKINFKVEEFDGVWISSLTNSIAKGLPDIGFATGMDVLHQVLDVTTKPVIVDGRNGGLPEHFRFTVRTLERLGVSAITISDEIDLNESSLSNEGTGSKKAQESMENFSRKISLGKKAQVTNDFMIFAKIGSLIIKLGVDDAIARAKAYIAAGADGIMIYSNNKEPTEILDFCSQYSQLAIKVPLILSPSSYCQVTETELIRAGANMVVYEDTLLRSAYPSMVKMAESILLNKGSYEADKHCAPINEILPLIPKGE